MRTEQEMLDLIIGFAKGDERIRAVYMNGSRVNPTAPKDPYQDYDIVYVVKETEPFLADRAWLSSFGNPLMIQEPDWNDILLGLSNDQYDFSRRYAWLMLLDDGSRIDLSIIIKEEAAASVQSDSLTVLLLDKDAFLPSIPAPSDVDYRVKKPSEGEYTACCNEFWWCLNNVAKGIARDELPYAMGMYNLYVRDMLNKMVEWHIGIQTDFLVSPGKMGKYFKRYLAPELYAMYQKTYSDSDYDALWPAVFTACALFRMLAEQTAGHFGYAYNQKDDANMTRYLYMVKHDERTR